jgi:ATP-dependent DNA helicase DinG
MNYAVIDFETTGNQPGDEIIQIGLVRIEDDRITDRFASFVKPRRAELPEFIRRLTGIDESMLADAPDLEDVMPRVLPYLQDAVLVAHQASFDLAFLQRGLDQCGYSPFDGPVLDTLDFLRIVYPGLSTLQLSMVSQSFELEHDQPHRADSDAEAAARIFLQCLEKLQRLPLLTLQRLADLFAGGQPQLQDMAWFFQELLHRKQLQSALDEDQHRYFRQFALRVDDWTEEAPPRGEGEADALDSDFDAFCEDLKQRMASRFPGYEHRQAQERMIREIMDALESGKHLMIEAGTGTGKSLGYLIPALYYGIKHEAKITVSTHTINLQEQIRKRDIPLLQELFPVPFQAAVLKGRSHYLCLRKFEYRMNRHEFEMSRDETIAAAQMLVWLSETEHGEDEEINFGSKGLEFWHSVASDADSCLNRACPWFRKCFFHRAKHRANLADVVITNHSLLFTDLKAEHRLIPTYRHLIVDEAHHLEETAGKHLGLSVTYLALANTMQILYRDQRSGQLPGLCRQMAMSGNEKQMDAAARLQGGFDRLVEAKEAWDAFHDFLYQTYLARLESAQDGGSTVLRIKPDQPPRRWETAEKLAEKFVSEMMQWLKQTERILDELKEDDEDSRLTGIVTDIGGLLKELQRLTDTVRTFMRLDDPDSVYWIEGSHYFKSKSIQLNCVPIDVSGKLKEAFFDKKDSVILTSATLSVNRSFDYTAEQLGLAESKKQGRLSVVQLPSPFNYRDNVLVCIPRDFPRINGAAGEAEFTERLVDSLSEVAESTRGRMLVLFTSYRMLKDVHGLLKMRLSPHGIEVLGQGIDSGNRSKLTRWFQESEAAVLLGTSSFWEGVDIPGEALSCLAIVRLPFQPPNHPIVEAKSEYMRKQNRNPFMDYSVPQAVIRFKQGFGRLVRTSGDYGIVIVYDTRVLDTQYGRHFLYSLPGPKMEHMPTNLLVGRVQEWLQRKGDDTHDQIDA